MLMNPYLQPSEITACLIYLLQLLLISLGLGCWTYHQTRLFPAPGLSRFLTGFCLSPFILGAWMFIPSALIPGASKGWFLIPPLLLACILLFLYGPRTLRRLARYFNRNPRFYSYHWIDYLAIAGAIVVLLSVLYKVGLNCTLPTINTDASSYLGEALRFTNERSLSAITGMEGSPDGSLRGEVHGFMYPAFISHALMNTSAGSFGYPHDLAAQVAFQATFIYMIIAVIALVSAIHSLSASAIALILLFQVPQFFDITYASDRDGYRIIPLLLLTVVLIGLSPNRMKRQLRPESLIAPVVLSACALAGHTLGGFVVVAMTAAWVIWVIPARPRWFNVLIVSTALGAGLLIGGTHYIKAYLDTGSVMGNVFKENAIKDTPLWEENLKRDQSRLQGTTTITDRLKILLKRDHYRLSVPGILSALIVILLWKKFYSDKKLTPLPFLGLIILLTILLATGIFDTTQYQLSAGFVMNFRYNLHWYPFAAVCLALIIGYVADIIDKSANQNFKQAGLILLSILILVVSLSSARTVRQWQARPSGYENQWFIKYFDPLNGAIEQIAPDKRLLLDYNYNYYLHNRAVVMYALPTWPVLQAKNEAEVAHSLEELHIGAIALNEMDSSWWQVTPLYSFLTNPDNANLVKQNKYYNLYILK